jgi:hypothetical protein
MNSTRRTATVVGALFLIAMGASLLGGGLIDSTLDVSAPLAAAQDSSAKVVIGVLLELVNGAAVVGIAVLLFPLLRRRSQAMAFGYVGFRIIETALIAVAAVIPVALIQLGRTYPGADGGSVGALGTALLATREQLLGLGVATFFCLGAVLLYSVLYRSRLVPRYISVWGFIGVAAVFALNVIQALAGGEATGASMVLAVPVVTNEIFLGIWLMTKGFNEESAASAAAHSGAAERRLESA